VLVALGWAMAASGFAAGSAWRVVSGEVRVECPMTVGGSFEARTNAIEGTVTLAPSAVVFAGELSVDLRTLDTGIGLRDEHLKGRYLEVDRGPEFERAILSEIRLGEGDPLAVQGKARFTGTFRLHGTRRPIAGVAAVRRQEGAVRVEASFPVTVTEFGIARPEYLGVGVKDQVNVKVLLVARPLSAEEATR
jgi:polyisoprenoid-binding protein YceI